MLIILSTLLPLSFIVWGVFDIITGKVAIGTFMVTVNLIALAMNIDSYRKNERHIIQRKELDDKAYIIQQRFYRNMDRLTGSQNIPFEDIPSEDVETDSDDTSQIGIGH